MQVKDVMTHGVKSVQASDSVTHAAGVMREFDVGAVPVFEGNRIVGILTDRDIVLRIVAMSLNPAHASVGEIMSKEIASCSENADIQEAAKIMENYRIRRILVRDEKGDISGITSLGDLALHAGKDISAEVLSCVSEHIRRGR